MLADELASRCCTSAHRDKETVAARSAHEGISFLTITLPTFAKGFERALELGQFDRNLVTSFKWQAGLPSFLRGFLDRVFDRNSGVLLAEPDIDSIQAIRQLTLMFGKVNLPCTPARVRSAIDGYIECEQDVENAYAELDGVDYLAFTRISALLFDDVLKEADRKIHDLEVVPKHGPGSTADRLLGNEKFSQLTWPERLNEIFPIRDFLVPNRLYDLEGQHILEPGSETPAKVISVPKTLKTPRIIAKEPTAMQYAQQGILEVLLESLSSRKALRRMIGFDDQTPNQRMARDGSREGALATLDLSEASDRVNNEHVKALLVSHAALSKAVEASRSSKAHVPGHGVIPLTKFASMGSALTFPLEAMVFTAIIFLGIERELNTPLCRKTVKSLSDRVRVYGDDIIVPVEYVHSVVRSLEAFGLKVNVNKSFWNGKFRESCGREYYDGEDVSIVRVRQMFPSSRRDAAGVVSLVSLRNQLYFAGAWQTVKWLDGEIRDVIKHFPTVLPSSPVLGRHSCLGFQFETLHRDHQAPLVRGWVVSAKIPSNILDGAGALVKFFTKRGDSPSHDVEHLMRSGRASDVRIKLRLGSAI